MCKSPTPPFNLSFNITVVRLNLFLYNACPRHNIHLSLTTVFLWGEHDGPVVGPSLLSLQVQGTSLWFWVVLNEWCKRLIDTSHSFCARPVSETSCVLLSVACIRAQSYCTVLRWAMCILVNLALSVYRGIYCFKHVYYHNLFMLITF